MNKSLADFTLVTQGIFNVDRKFHRKGQWIFIVKFYVDSKKVSEKSS